MQSTCLILLKIVSYGRQAILIAHQKSIFVNNMSLRIVLNDGKPFISAISSLVIFAEQNDLHGLIFSEVSH